MGEPIRGLTKLLIPAQKLVVKSLTGRNSVIVIFLMCLEIIGIYVQDLKEKIKRGKIVSKDLLRADFLRFNWQTDLKFLIQEFNSSLKKQEFMNLGKKVDLIMLLRKKSIK